MKKNLSIRISRYFDDGSFEKLLARVKYVRQRDRSILAARGYGKIKTLISFGYPARLQDASSTDEKVNG